MNPGGTCYLGRVKFCGATGPIYPVPCFSSQELHCCLCPKSQLCVKYLCVVQKYSKILDQLWCTITDSC